ncbi:hypothetical protein PQ459_12230 [Chryseobacterium sp. KACC 21268]|nr:hypothetical protein PQ459_12230 [Chryseobacterium sp. KACC 21268]
MITEYKYRPPLKYFLVGLCGITMSFIFGLALGKNEIWFSILIGIFSLMSLMLGVGFLTIFFRKFASGNLIIGKDFIEIPGRWKMRVKLHFEEIVEIGEIDTYDNVIEIDNGVEIYLIESSWMKQRDFEDVKRRLKDYWINQ